jgi:hypothetical protein
LIAQESNGNCTIILNYLTFFKTRSQRQLELEGRLVEQTERKVKEDQRAHTKKDEITDRKKENR